MTISMLAKPTLLSLGLMSIGLMSIIGCTTNHSLNQTANQPMTQTAASQATVYYNGDIITMASDEPEMVEALVTKAGKIAYVGSLTEAQNKYKSAAQVNLKNQTLLPRLYRSAQPFWTGVQYHGASEPQSTTHR